MTSVHEIIAAAEKLWPSSAAEEWDRPGLIAGSMSSVVTKVLLSVDVTAELVADAKAGGFQMVLSHHPLLLRGVNSVAEHTAKGRILGDAIRGNVALYAAHTNADITQTGVSATLASALGLRETTALQPPGEEVGHGRLGKLPSAIKLIEFARAVAKVLPATAGGVRVAGNPEMTINRVALCGGAGDSFIGAAIAADADVYITSDLRHHPAQDSIEAANAQGKELALIDISHWAAESLWLEVAAKELSNLLPGVKFVVSDLRTDPWDFAVTQ